MAFTTTMSVTSVAAAQVIANSYCRKIILEENPGVTGWPTAQFLIVKSVAGSKQIRMLAGVQYVFAKEDGSHYYPGEVAGTIQMVNGTTTFNVDEWD